MAGRRARLGGRAAGRPASRSPGGPSSRTSTLVDGDPLPVGGGAVWLKSVGPGSAHEPLLAAALGEWVPDHVLVPLAVDPGRRLMLLPDGGPTLRAAGGGARRGVGGDARATTPGCSSPLAEHADGMVASASPTPGPTGCPASSLTCSRTTRPCCSAPPTGSTPRCGDRLVADLDRYADLCARSPTAAPGHAAARRPARRERVRRRQRAPLLRLGRRVGRPSRS